RFAACPSDPIIPSAIAAQNSVVSLYFDIFIFGCWLNYVLGETAAQGRSREVQARRKSDVLGKERTRAATLRSRAERVLAQRDRGSVSQDAPLKNRLNETILARRPGIENRRNLLRLNLGYVNDVWK